MDHAARHRSIRLALCLLALASFPARAQDALVGPAEAVDGRTLRVAGEVVRLADIDAPDPAQTCTMKGRNYPCGRLARTALADLLAGARVECRIAGRAADGPPIASCMADGFDLSLNMVHTGWALADRRQSTRYVEIENSAREAKRGLWRGDFQPPSAWRLAVSGE